MNAVIPNQHAVVEGSLSWDLLIGQFLAAVRVKQSSKSTYKRQLRAFLRWAAERGQDPRWMNKKHIIAYVEYLEKDKGLSPYSVSGYLTAVRKFFAWMEEESGGEVVNVAKTVEGAKKPHGFRKEVLTRAQVRQVLGAIDRSTLEGKRDYALINLVVRTGLRTIEVARAKIGDLRQRDGAIILEVQRKGHDAKDDLVVLTEEAVGPIYEYLAARGVHDDDAPLFASLSNRNRGQHMTTRSISAVVKNRLRAVGLDTPRLTAHSLRHTAITLAVQGGASLHQAQAMAGHRDPKTTMIYFHNTDRIEQAAEKRIAI